MREERRSPKPWDHDAPIDEIYRGITTPPQRTSWCQVLSRLHRRICPDWRGFAGNGLEPGEVLTQRCYRSLERRRDGSL